MHGLPFAATIFDMRTSSPLELSSKVSPFFWALMAACFSDIPIGKELNVVESGTKALCTCEIHNHFVRPLGVIQIIIKP